MKHGFWRNLKLKVMEKALQEAHDRLILMLDTSPLCAQIWDRELNTIDCNEAGIRLYGFKNKAEYTERFLAECSPEFQPDGRRSDEKAVFLVNKAFEEGYCLFEWMHRLPDSGVVFPAEVTLVRAKYKDDDVVIGYTRDLREHYRMMEDIEYRDRLLYAVNRAATYLLNSDVDSFEESLHQSMKIIADVAGIDCVYLWQNQIINNALYCFQIFEWSPKKTMFADGKPYSYDDVVPGWEEILSSGNTINNLVRNLSPKEQEHLTPSGILSILVVPIFINDHFWGFVGFDDCSIEKVFSQEEESILHSASLIIANSFIRNEMIQSIRVSSNQLMQQDKLMTAVNQAATLLLTTKDDVDIEAPLMASMELVANSIDADRVVIWRNEIIDGVRYHVCEYKWVSELGLQQTPVPIGFKLSHDIDRPEWTKSFVNGDHISGPLSNLLKRDQVFLSQFGMKSIALIPLFLDEHFWGLFSIDNCKSEYNFTEDEIAILRSVSLMMVNAINRHALVEKRTKDLALETATLTTLFDAIPDFIFTKDFDLRFMHCNKAFLEHYGRQKEDVVGKSDIEAFGTAPEVAAAYNKADREAMLEGRIITVEEKNPRIDGADLIFETTKMPLILDGIAVGMMGIARDITMRKERERRVAADFVHVRQQSESLTRVTTSSSVSNGDIKEVADLIVREGCEVLRTSLIGVWKLKDENTLENISCYETQTNEYSIHDDYDLSLRPRYSELIKSERLVIMNNKTDVLSIFDTYPDSAGDLLCAALDSPIFVDGKLFGVVCVEQFICEEFPDGRRWRTGERSYASSLSDLMALTVANFERRKARDEAHAASQAKSDFLANMSHEIRTPMNVIVGLTELLLEGDTPVGSEKEYLQKINTAGVTLTGLINDVLDISKIESGKFTLSNTNYELAKLLNDIVALSIVRIEEKPIAFNLEIGLNMPVYLYGDDLRVKQIFLNLLSNAFKYTHEGTVTLNVSCKKESADEIGVSISVIDTGIGMRKEDMDNLFSDYNQVDTHANRAIEGTGLGLSIVKGLTEIMGGDISVESEYGRGSVFRVDIRQGFVNDELIDADTVKALRSFRYKHIKQTDERLIERPDLSWAKVLVVDDSPTNLDVAMGVLGKYKMTVDCVTNGQDSIDRISLGQPIYNAIFMDHMMPGMDGIEAAKLIRAIGTEYAESIPIIALTANAVAGNEQMFLDQGFQAFVSKPISIKKLDSVIRQWIASADALPRPVSADTCPETKPPHSPTGQMPVIPGVNAKLGLSLYEGDMDLYIDILRSYVENTPAELDKLRGVSEENLSLYAIDIHTMKGVNSTIGAKEMTERAKSMELMAKAGDFDGVSELNEQFIKDTEILVSNIQAWLAG
jgi:PAS domain S-box-containing protein